VMSKGLKNTKREDKKETDPYSSNCKKGERRRTRISGRKNVPTKKTNRVVEY